MKYHKMKMEEINKIIKEYWRMTYKGNGKIQTKFEFYCLIFLSYVAIVIDSDCDVEIVIVTYLNLSVGTKGRHLSRT